MTRKPAKPVPSKARLLASAAIIAGALTIPCAAVAEEALIWTQKSNGDLSSLIYGPLDPAAIPLLMISCFSDMGIVVLDVHKEVSGAKAGEKVSIELSSAKAQAPIQGEVSVNETTGKTFGEASDIKLQPVLQVLRDPGPVTLKIGDATATLSDQGRDVALAEFSKNCSAGN